MLLVLGSYAPSLSNFCGRSGADILRARQAVAECICALRARCQALAETRNDVRTEPAMRRAMGLR
jgi:hypothetical protein